MKINGSYFGKWVRSVRVAKGLNSTQAAELMGFKYSQSIANIESGRSPFPIRHAKKFCRVMGVPEVEFIKQMVKAYESHLAKELGAKRAA